MLDLLSAKKLIEQALIDVKWMSIQRQYADRVTKDMVRDHTKQHLERGTIRLIQTGTDAEREQHKATLRTAQRERSKEHVQQTKTCLPRHVVYRW